MNRSLTMGESSAIHSQELIDHCNMNIVTNMKKLPHKPPNSLPLPIPWLRQAQAKRSSSMRCSMAWWNHGVPTMVDVKSCWLSHAYVMVR